MKLLNSIHIQSNMKANYKLQTTEMFALYKCI